MKKRKNELNHQAFEEVRQQVEKAFPYGGIRKGIYIKDTRNAGVLGSMVKVAVSAVVNFVGDNLNLRTYRHPKEPESAVRYKVDELRGVNKEVVELMAGYEVPNHHIPHDVPEDMMAQNHMTFEAVGDGKGGLKLNTKSDGMVQAYVNFPDPTPELLKRAMERAKSHFSAKSEDSSKDLPSAAA